MNKNEKVELIENISNKFKNSSALYFTKYTGMNVIQATMLRSKFKENNLAFYNLFSLDLIGLVNISLQSSIVNSSMVFLLDLRYEDTFVNFLLYNILYFSTTMVMYKKLYNNIFLQN